MFKNSFKPHALVSAAAAAAVALTLTVSPRAADAAQHQFALLDLLPTWALMFGGLGAVGSLARRRRGGAMT